MLVSRDKGDRKRQTAALAAKAYAAGRTAMADGDFDMARTAFRWARRADSKNIRYVHAEAVLAQRTGNPYEAENLHRRVIDVAERTFGTGHPLTMPLVANLIGLYEQAGRASDAMSVRDRIIDELDLQMAAFSSVRALTKIAEICIDAGRGGEAIEIFQRAVDQRRKIYGDGHAKLSECLERMKEIRARTRLLAETAAIFAGAGSARRGIAPTPADWPGSGAEIIFWN